MWDFVPFESPVTYCLPLPWTYLQYTPVECHIEGCDGDPWNVTLPWVVPCQDTSRKNYLHISDWTSRSACVVAYVTKHIGLESQSSAVHVLLS